ncbi:hypothetical protein J5N97_027833 [Dioscorea zingiberensis]|uniref:V-type proton ATPase subunit G n=1 Tax=Dioscorea zingiberensis TaxID=325984 RepID=A0A9D5BY18_9LILI|nr:hypothetical protein J5N97_027833 [Dioscorea zingiberensis]
MNLGQVCTNLGLGINLGPLIGPILLDFVDITTRTREREREREREESHPSLASWTHLLCWLNMDSNRRQGGIQQLLAAEQEAQHIVNAARNAKMARLKQAKEEADKEAAEFRAKMEAEYQRKVAQSTGDSGSNYKRLELETEEKIQHLKSEAEKITRNVVHMLLKQVTTVKN